jgi:hypothetical protein
MEFVTLRYKTNGVIDTTYGLNGMGFVDFEDGVDNNLNAMALDGSGRAVVAGNAGGLFGAGRLQADPRLIILSLSQLINGHTLLTGTGAPNAQHTLQAATNLNAGSFGVIGTVLPDNAGNWQYEDTTAGNLPARFYRLAFP